MLSCCAWSACGFVIHTLSLQFLFLNLLVPELKNISRFMKHLMLAPVFKPQFVVTGSCNAAYACFLDKSPPNGVWLGKSPHVLLTARSSTDDELLLTIGKLRDCTWLGLQMANPALRVGNELDLIRAVQDKIPDLSCARLSLIVSYLGESPDMSVEQATYLLCTRIFNTYERDLVPVFEMEPSIEETLRRLSDGNGPWMGGQWRAF